VLSVYGAFDGAAAWALRIAMEETAARNFVVDLTHAEEACEFAAGLLASWTRRWGRLKAVRFRPGTAEQARLLSGYGLELAEDARDDDDAASVELADETQPEEGLGIGLPLDWPVTTSGASA
jgi:hypothetical protein